MQDSRKKILVIEDDHETADLITEELVDRGFDVQVTYDGMKGYSAILRSPPDLILCDITMPTASGFDVLERLAVAAPCFRKIPFIFVTAMIDREVELKARQLGADDFVTKPIDFVRLETILDARLAGVARNGIWPKLVDMTDREVEVLTWAARGKTSAEIAIIVGLSKRTIDFHLDNARIKLGAATRIEAAIKAVTGRLIHP